ncbi:MAG: hypothetical protein JXM70_10110 [Pirellulales bacterium]|nr:hypothetical protein [Pirellulales bacterium]
MARIKRLWLFTTTSTESYAGTRAQLRLEIVSHNGDKVWDDLGDPQQNDRECGQTGCQELILSETDKLDDAQIKEIRLRIHDAYDAWKPSSIWIISENVDGEIKLLSANPDWNSWFDPESRPGYALRLLP